LSPCWGDTGGRNLTEVIKQLLEHPQLATVVISMLPVVELRGGLPFGLSQGLSPLTAYVWSVLGNLVPVAPVFVALRWGSVAMRKFGWSNRILAWLERRVARRRHLVDRYGVVGVVLLVAIPLPVTGAWTGTLVSVLLFLRLRQTLPAISLGVAIAGIIVLLVSLGVLGSIHFFVGM